MWGRSFPQRQQIQVRDNSGDMNLSCLPVKLLAPVAAISIVHSSNKAWVNLCTNCLDVVKCQRTMHSINESLFHTVYLTVAFLPYRFYGLFHKKWCAGSWWCSPCAFRGLFWWWPSGLLSEMTTGGLRWRLWGPLFCSMPCCLSAVWYSTAFLL